MNNFLLNTIRSKIYRMFLYFSGLITFKKFDTSFTFIIIFFTAYYSYAEDFRNSKWPLIGYEHFLKGNYESVIEIENKICPVKLKNDTTYLTDYVFCKLLVTKSLYGLFLFNDANKNVNEIKEICRNNPSNNNIALLLAEYFLENNQYEVADSILKNKSNSTLFLLLKNKLDLKNGNYEIVSKRIGFVDFDLKLVKNIGLQDVLIENYHFENQQNKVDYLIDLAKYDSVFNLLNTLQSKNYILNQLIKRYALETSARIFGLQNKPYKEVKYYREAYDIEVFSSIETKHLYLLTKSVYLLRKSNQLVAADDLLRRLQLYAFQGRRLNSPFQLWYQLANINNKILLHTYHKAKLSEPEFLINSQNVPKEHILLKEFYETQLTLNLKLGNWKEAIDLCSEVEKKSYGLEKQKWNIKKSKLIFEFSEKPLNAQMLLNETQVFFNTNPSILISQTGIDYLTFVSEIYLFKMKYDSALFVAKKIDTIANFLYKLKSGNVFSTKILLTKCLYNAGKMKEMKEEISVIETILATISQEQQTDYLKNITELIYLYEAIGESNKCSKLLNRFSDESIEIGEEVDLLINNENKSARAQILLEINNFSKAEKIINNLLTDKKSKFNLKSLTMINDYETSFKIHINSGNFKLAEQNLDLYASLINSIGEKSVSYYFNYLLMLSDYSFALGDYNSAHENCLITDEYLKENKNVIKRVEVLSRLASYLPYTKGKEAIKEAISYLDQSLDLISDKIGQNNDLYMNLIQKKIDLYIWASKPDEAFKLIEQSESYWKSELGNDIGLSKVYYSKGEIYYLKNNYKESEDEFKKSQTIIKKTFSKNHPSYVKIDAYLARIAFMENEFNKAFLLLSVNVLPKYLNFTKTHFPSLSFREKSKYWSIMKEDFELFNHLVISKSPTDPIKVALMYNYVVSTKGILLSADMKLRESIITSGDSILIATYENWVHLRETHTQAAALSDEQLKEQQIDLGKLENEIEKLEKSLSNRSELFKENEKLTKYVAILNVKMALSKNEYAVEIIRARRFNKIMTDSMDYAAIVLSKYSLHPHLVVLPNGYDLDNRNFNYYRNKVMSKLNDNLSYIRFWKPIKELIPSGSKIYLSSEGVYNQLNIETLQLPNQDTTFAFNENSFVFVSNTKDILNKTKTVSKKTQSSNLYLLGNPKFYTSKVKKEMVSSLPGAAEEISQIDSIRKAMNVKWPSFILMDAEVTEESLKKLKSPKLFHIATHGYYKSTNAMNEDNEFSDPMLNSGLMLSGSGNILTGKKNINSNSGILTAYEAQMLSFDNTDLVVLSACETGKGGVKVGEGVYGLQRAFLIAGANKLILSLFKVDDEITKTLMSAFYQKWFLTYDVQSSFYYAKQKVKSKYRFPIYWGAFVLIDGKPKN